MLQELKLQEGETFIHVQILRSARKTIALEVKEETEVLMRIPMRLPDREIRQFVKEHEQWIFDKTRLMKNRMETCKSTQAVEVNELSAEEIAKIKETIALRVRHYSRIMGVTTGTITIRNQKTRWGSCSGKGNLNFNYQLYYLPQELLDYVVVHELAHRRHMDHSGEFWREVETYCPMYRTYRKQLKEYRLV